MNKNLKKNIFTVLIFAIFFANAQNQKSEYESALFFFRADKFSQAVELFEKAKTAQNFPPEIFIYLGVAYAQLGDFENSLRICNEGLLQNDTNKKILYYNAGNACFALENFDTAKNFFQKALNEDENFLAAILNLANTFLKIQDFQKALLNYEKFLELSPNDSQSEAILQIVEKLKEKIAQDPNVEELIDFSLVNFLNEQDAKERESQKIKLESVGEEYFLKIEDGKLQKIVGEKISSQELSADFENLKSFEIQSAEFFVTSEKLGGEYFLTIQNGKIKKLEIEKLEMDFANEINSNDFTKEDLKIEKIGEDFLLRPKSKSENLTIEKFFDSKIKIQNGEILLKED